MVDLTQNEVFIINDIDMGVSPSDIQVMDDNWVMEDSYVRSKAVFCYRSKYSATKVVLNIPFQITYLTQDNKESLNNTFNCIKLVTQLASYPFCFIKNNRIRAYISPYTMSATGFMMFAVDEIAIIQDAQASNMVFLEVVLQYYNHTPLIKDFEFGTDLEIYQKHRTSVAVMKEIQKIGLSYNEPVVSSLKSSEVWKKYMSPRVTNVLNNLTKSGLLNYVNEDTRTIHPIMGVKILAPNMSEIKEGIDSVDDGRYIGPDAKVVTVTNTSYYDNGSFEDLLGTFSKQDFSFSSPKFENTEAFQTANSEDRIKNSEVVVRNTEKTTPPYQTQDERITAEAERGVGKNKKDVFIEWVGLNIQELGVGIQKIEIRKKNKLATHQIGTYKHPIVQYMGKYPTTLNVTMASNNFDVYKDDEAPANTFLKHVLNILDYNRNAIPEAEAYNFIKIKSLATFLLSTENFLPSQSLISASSSQQGLESIVYSFHEGDLSSFLEQGVVEASGKTELDTTEEDILNIIVEWLKGSPTTLTSIVNHSVKEYGINDAHILSTYKAIVELTKEALQEMQLQNTQYYKGVETVIEYLGDFQKGNNVVKNVVKINSNEIAAFQPYKLYNKYERQDGLYINNIKITPDVSTNQPLKVSVLQMNMHLIPFMVFVLSVRKNIMNGKGTTIPGISFTPSGRFNNLALSILSKINTGVKAGAVVNNKFFSSDSNKNIIDKVSKGGAKSFFGYNLEDLYFEDFYNGKYDKQKDILLPTISPFFFLKQKTVLNGTELENIYEKMYKGSEYNKDLTDHLNNVKDTDKDKVDSTVSILPIEYRKLNEIEYEELDTRVSFPEVIGTMGLAYGLAESFGVMEMPIGSYKPRNLKQMPQEAINAIEKALKKYGKSNDEAFRTMMYAFFHKESNNQLGVVSPTGATGMFQFVNSAAEDLLRGNHSLEYSNGTKIGRSPNTKVGHISTLAKQVKAASQTDHYLAAQMFIEKTLKEQNNLTKVNGAVSPIYTYIQHNIGKGGLEDVRNIMEGRTTTFNNKKTKENIGKQNKGLIESTDVATAKEYYHFMAARIAIDNVPTSVRSGGVTKTTTPVKKEETKGIATTTTKNAATQLLDNLSSQNKKVLGDQPVIPYQNQAKTIDTLNGAYSGVVKSVADTVDYQDISTKVIKGVVIKVTDGDTVTIKDPKTNKTTDIRLYGVDTPEDTTKHEVYGNQAAKALRDLTLNKEVNITLAAGNDKHGRTVGQVKLKDGTDVSLTMLRNGYGFVSQGFTSLGIYTKAEQEAKNNRKGLWSYPDGVITRPRATQINLDNISKTVLQEAKTSKKGAVFTASELKNAQKHGKMNVNDYQPFAGGKKFRVSSFFGWRTNPRVGMHHGVDLASPSGTTVVAAAPGKVIFSGVAGGYGGLITIDHGNGFITKYGHMKKRFVKNGQVVSYGESIGLSGGGRHDENRGSSTGSHLHYEVRYKGASVNPFGTKVLTTYSNGVQQSSGATPENGSMEEQVLTMPEKVLSDVLPELQITRKGVTKENTIYNEEKLSSAIFENIYKNVNMGLDVSLPAIKIYMTVGNENDKFWLDTLKGDILYYELKGVQSFHMNCNNDNNPIDTALITIADPSFFNTDGYAGIDKMPGVNVNAIGTSDEMQFKNDRIQLKVGNKLHVRLGYGNDPNELDIVFNGSIADIQIANQSLNLVCESFGKELLSEIIASNKPEFLNEQSDNISTSSVIGESLIAETIEHFGYNSGFIADKLRDTTDPESRSLAPGRFSFSYNYFFDFTKASYKSRLFMNVFAPEIEKIDDEFNRYKGWFSVLATMFTNHASGYPFAVYRMTPWQCMKQMEYRHPNTICKPMVYEDRMSLFYGVKEQMYFKKDLNKALQMSAADQKDNHSSVGHDLTEYYKRRRERMAPVSNIHLVTSDTNLISNGLRINANYATKIKVNYYDSASDALSGKPYKLETFDAKADDNLYPFDIRTKELTLSGAIGKYSAFLYGTTELKKEAEKMYGGKIRIIGNPTMKAGDYVFLEDTNTRMSGLVLVRECYHHFDAQIGYITEFVPGQYVEAANFMYSSLWLNLMCSCKLATAKLKTVLSDNYSSDDFDMVTSWLTVINQVQLELENVNNQTSFSENKEVSAIAGSMVLLSGLLCNTLSKMLGISREQSILKMSGTNIGTGVSRFSKAFLRLYLKKTDVWLWERFKDRVTKDSKHYGGKTLKWANGKVDYEKLNKLKTTKIFISGKTFYDKIVKSKSSGLAWTVSKPILGLSGKALYTAANIVGRTLFTGVIAALVANPFAILLDVIFYAAIQYGFAYVEKEKLMRQPLLYFPIIRHGKPYVGGMAGVVRNSWWDSTKTEYGKTLKEAQKTASILAGNSDVTNLKHDRSFLASLLSSTVDQNTMKRTVPLYQTNSNGERVIVHENSVTTEALKNSKEVRQKEDYAKKEETMKQQLIQQSNDKTVGVAINGL